MSTVFDLQDLSRLDAYGRGELGLVSPWRLCSGSTSPPDIQLDAIEHDLVFVCLSQPEAAIAESCMAATIADRFDTGPLPS
ncbi:hypothetical protein ACFLIM_25245 [Nonomuraea sp. M3C6]|uniref:Uncharacterized protein n=1 Tax=Nonomuraea marmarensis TaxID=3351344 RepID=A0ABW7AGL5_9ACTN